VKTRDHYKGVNFNAKEETVRKFTQTCTMHISKNERELVGILLQTEDGRFNFFAKTRPEGRGAWPRTNLERPRVRLAQAA